MRSFEFGDAVEAEFGGPVIGIDEAGRGPLAGPVVACAVAVLDKAAFLRKFKEVNDSKKLSQSRRIFLSEALRQSDFIRYSIASASVEDIDSMNIRNATLMAMAGAIVEMEKINGMSCSYIVDGNIPIPTCLPGKCLIHGDAISYRIAAASIIAKVYRDDLMATLAKDFPEYGWERNAGYGTAEHIGALQTHGATVHHRKTFARVAGVPDHGIFPANDNCL
jgi:ribonuclease HII